MREACAQGSLILPKHVGYMNITIYFGEHLKFLQTAVSYPHVTFLYRTCPSTSMRFRLKA